MIRKVMGDIFFFIAFQRQPELLLIKGGRS